MYTQSLAMKEWGFSTFQKICQIPRPGFLRVELKNEWWKKALRSATEPLL